jgi:hypothetical protein
MTNQDKIERLTAKLANTGDPLVREAIEAELSRLRKNENRKADRYCTLQDGSRVKAGDTLYSFSLPFISDQAYYNPTLEDHNNRFQVRPGKIIESKVTAVSPDCTELSTQQPSYAGRYTYRGRAGFFGSKEAAHQGMIEAALRDRKRAQAALEEAKQKLVIAQKEYELSMLENFGANATFGKTEFDTLLILAACGADA